MKINNLDIPVNNPKDFSDVCVCAFRYALGRKSYIVSTIADFLINNKEFLEKKDRELIIKEITEAEEVGRLGMEMDKEDWLKVREELKK